MDKSRGTKMNYLFNKKVWLIKTREPHIMLSTIVTVKKFLKMELWQVLRRAVKFCVIVSVFHLAAWVLCLLTFSHSNIYSYFVIMSSINVCMNDVYGCILFNIIINGITVQLTVFVLGKSRPLSGETKMI